MRISVVQLPNIYLNWHIRDRLIYFSLIINSLIQKNSSSVFIRKKNEIGSNDTPYIIHFN